MSRKKSALFNTTRSGMKVHGYVSVFIGLMTKTQNTMRHIWQKGIKMKKLVLNYKGRDSWSRPVYEANERLYVDVDPRKDRKPNICTKYNNEFDGEPDDPIPSDIQIEFVPCRDVWD